jgi:ABC-type Zn2+ transport system substrate-binding protein/surface adhesin
MAIRELASVDPDAVKVMHQKIHKLQEDLATVSKKIKNDVETLHREGFKDVKFTELQNTLLAHNSSMQSLQNFMSRYENYLKEQEKILRRYLESMQLKTKL